MIASDIRELPGDKDGPFRILDVRDANMVHEAMERTEADTIIHMAGILSAKGEEYPQLAWDINIQGIYNVLEVARGMGLDERQILLRVALPLALPILLAATPLLLRLLRVRRPDRKSVV